MSEDSPLTDALLCSAAAVPASPPAGAAEAAVSAPDAEAAVSSAAPLSAAAADDAAVLLSAAVDSAAASVVPEDAASLEAADSLEEAVSLEEPSTEVVTSSDSDEPSVPITASATGPLTLIAALYF